MIPPIFKFTGDESEAKSLMGFGRRRLAKLLNDMHFQKLDTHKDNPLIFPDGTTIGCTSNHGLNEINIHVPRGGGAEEGKSVFEYLDNRFFVRVGKPSDVVVDGLGHVVSDKTRYYWIDFAAHPKAASVADQIAFHDPKRGKKKIKTIGSKAYYVKARQVTDETFLYVVNYPDYMFHNYVRSFDLARESNNPEAKKDRFVAGYHFLATGDSIIFAPEIPLPAGGEYDENEVSKNPPNRFFVDIPSRTMCWYHVLQKWKVTEPITHTESTGSIAGIVVDVDYVGKKWATNGIGQLFSINGEIAVTYSIPTTGVENMYQPVGVVSDVTALNRANIEFDLSYLSTPIHAVCSIGPAGFIVESCVGQASISTALCVADGYEFYQAATYEYASGNEPDITRPETAVDIDYGVVDCTESTICAENGGPLQKIEEGWGYYETTDPWSELHVGLSVFGIDAVGYSDIESGRNNGQYVEDVYCIVHYCRQDSGPYCADATSGGYANRSLSGHVTGMFGTKQDITIPCQNVTILTSTTAETVGVDLERTITGPDGGELTGDLGHDLAHWSLAQPMLAEAPSPLQLADTSYPKGYTMEDPANWLSLQNLPVEVPPLLYVYATPPSYWKRVSTLNSLSVVEDDKCVIKDCPDTFTASQLFSAVILDDRWSKGSQGIVVAVKSNIVSESAIYHNGVKKTQAIITALVRDKLIRAGESLIDIGLI